MAGITIDDRSLGRRRRNTWLGRRLGRLVLVLLAFIVVAAAFGAAYGIGALTRTQTLGAAPAPVSAVAAPAGAVRIVAVRSAPAVPRLKLPPPPPRRRRAPRRATVVIPVSTPTAPLSTATPRSAVPPITRTTTSSVPAPVSTPPITPVAGTPRPVAPAPVTRTTPAGTGTASGSDPTTSSGTSGVASGGG